MSSEINNKEQQEKTLTEGDKRAATTTAIGDTRNKIKELENHRFDLIKILKHLKIQQPRLLEKERKFKHPPPEYDNAGRVIPQVDIPTDKDGKMLPIRDASNINKGKIENTESTLGKTEREIQTNTDMLKALLEDQRIQTLTLDHTEFMKSSTDHQYKKVGMKIAEIRSKSGMTRGDLAANMTMAPGSGNVRFTPDDVVKMESGDADLLDQFNITVLTHVFRISARDLFCLPDLKDEGVKHDR